MIAVDNPISNALARPAQPDLSGQLTRLRAQRSAIFTPDDLTSFESDVMRLNEDLKSWSQNAHRSTGEVVAIAAAVLIGAFVMAAALYWAGDALLGAFDG